MEIKWKIQKKYQNVKKMVEKIMRGQEKYE